MKHGALARKRWKKELKSRHKIKRRNQAISLYGIWKLEPKKPVQNTTKVNQGLNLSHQSPPLKKPGYIRGVLRSMARIIGAKV